MSDITLDRLKEAQKVFSEYREIQDQIQAAYNTYHSPQYEYRKSKYENTDPVVQAFYKIEKLNDRLSDHLDFISAFEQDLKQIRNYEVQAIIRYHYILGYTWMYTTKKIYKEGDPSYSRQVLIRYLNNKETYGNQQK